MISGMTYKAAQKHARAEYEKLIENDIKLKHANTFGPMFLLRN